MNKFGKFIVLILILVFLTALMNYFVNPFGVFNTYEKPSPLSNKFHRIYIFPKLKLKKENPDYVVFGSSNALCYLNTGKLYEETGKSFYDVVIFACLNEEMLKLIDAYTQMYPQEKLLVALEFDHFTEDRAGTLPDFTGKYLNPQEIIFLLFSQNAIKASIYSIGEDLHYKKLYYLNKLLQKNKNLLKLPFFKDFKGNCHFENKRQPKLRYSNWNERQFKQSSFDYFAKIKKLTDERKIDAIFYLNPVNAYALSDIYLSGVYGEVEKTKREIAKVTPFYDFLYISKYSSEPVSLKNPYWFNSFHGNDALGTVIMDSLISDKKPFGVLVTQDNVEKVLKEQRHLLENFIKEHRKQIDEYRANTGNDYTEEHDEVCLD
ncbi:MAG: hypothetical protein K6C94_03935 [Candidatus Gastranaerophilales bacterium]|nr:hypothetical protein [Candidatus Gastranaerophilales bacterium]